MSKHRPWNKEIMKKFKLSDVADQDLEAAAIVAEAVEVNHSSGVVDNFRQGVVDNHLVNMLQTESITQMVNQQCVDAAVDSIVKVINIHAQQEEKLAGTVRNQTIS
jgi:hypothetical protein